MYSLYKSIRYLQVEWISMVLISVNACKSSPLYFATPNDLQLFNFITQLPNFGTGLQGIILLDPICLNTEQTIAVCFIDLHWFLTQRSICFLWRDRCKGGRTRRLTETAQNKNQIFDVSLYRVNCKCTLRKILFCNFIRKIAKIC